MRQQAMRDLSYDDKEYKAVRELYDKYIRWTWSREHSGKIFYDGKKYKVRGGKGQWKYLRDRYGIDADEIHVAIVDEQKYLLFLLEWS